MKSKIQAEHALDVKDWRNVAKHSLDMSVFPACRFKVVPWWFYFIGWMLPTHISTDGNFCIEAKLFRGMIYIVKCYRVNFNAR